MPNIAEKTWCELEEMKSRGVIIPIGSIEQHGPHLPLDTDSLLVEKIADAVGKKTGCLIAPTIRFGVSEEHMDFPGTLTLSPDSFKKTVSDVCRSLLRHGFTKQHILNYHGGNKRYLQELLPDIQEMRVEITLHRVLGRLGKFDHAGEVETSLMLYLFPEKVRKDKIERFSYRIPHGEGWKTKDYSTTGVIGDSIDSNTVKGREYFNRIINELVGELKDEQSR